MALCFYEIVLQLPQTSEDMHSCVFLCQVYETLMCVGGDVMHVWVCAPMGVHVEARDGCLMSSTVSVYLIFWTLTFLLQW